MTREERSPGRGAPPDRRSGEHRSTPDRASTGPLVTLYGKPGCHLCEEAREVVLSVRLEREFDLAEVDVTLDPGLNRAYGERIPVIAVEGEEAFEYFVDREALKDRLDRVIS